jgi:hypothetical protein
MESRESGEFCCFHAVSPLFWAAALLDPARTPKMDLPRSAIPTLQSGKNKKANPPAQFAINSYWHAE